MIECIPFHGWTAFGLGLTRRQLSICFRILALVGNAAVNKGKTDDEQFRALPSALPCVHPEVKGG